METLLKLNVFVCFLFSVGSEVSGSKGTVIVNQNFYFSNDDKGKLLPLRVRQLGLFLNCEITGANFFKFYFLEQLDLSNFQLAFVYSRRVESRQPPAGFAFARETRHSTAKRNSEARVNCKPKLHKN